MRSMEVNLGVIRDKQGIYSALLQSKSLNRQLAICYNSDGKLIVKICVVRDITRTREATLVTVVAPDETDSKIEIDFEHIESIYPIRDFIT